MSISVRGAKEGGNAVKKEGRVDELASSRWSRGACRSLNFGSSGTLPTLALVLSSLTTDAGWLIRKGGGGR